MALDVPHPGDRGAGPGPAGGPGPVGAQGGEAEEEGQTKGEGQLLHQGRLTGGGERLLELDKPLCLICLAGGVGQSGGLYPMLMLSAVIYCRAGFKCVSCFRKVRVITFVIIIAICINRTGYRSTQCSLF